MLERDFHPDLVYDFGPEYITTTQAQRLFKFFHLSYAGNIKTLQPRNPGAESVYPDMGRSGDPIEDYTTKRVSFAPNIARAQEALGYRAPYLYVADAKQDPSDDIETVDLVANLPSCPSSSANRYGPGFEWDKYWDKHGNPPRREREQKQKKMLRGCVPDAKKTKEIWSTRRVKALRLGEVDGNDIYLSKEAKKYLEQIGVRIRK